MKQVPGLCEAGQKSLDARFERYANDFAWLVAARSAPKTVNVSRGQRRGKPVHYLPLYMAGLVAAEASTPLTDAAAFGGFVLDPVDFSAFV